MSKFTATVTPSTVVKGNAANGVRYSLMQNASVERRSRGGKPVTQTRTVMAFGAENAAVANILRAGKAIQVQCEYRGGMIKIVGKAPKASKAA